VKKEKNMANISRRADLRTDTRDIAEPPRTLLKLITTHAWVYVLLAVLLIVQFLPIAWVLLTSFMTVQETTSVPATLLPTHPTFTSYILTLQGDISRYYNNSTIASLVSTIITMILATLAAYAFARLHFRFKTPLLLFMLSLSLFPPLAQVIPIYQVLQKLHLIGSLAALIVPYSIMGLPLAVLVLIAIFQEIPFDLEEAAAVDGLTRWGAFLRIFLPVTLPGLFTAAVIVFVGDWNEYLFALNYTTPNTHTLPVGLVTISQTDFATNFDLIAAATIISVIPLIVRILMMERRIISGLTISVFKK
jgi:ABC-type glycerol-3-phosphate transport system permease component